MFVHLNTEMKKKIMILTEVLRKKIQRKLSCQIMRSFNNYTKNRCWTKGSQHKCVSISGSLNINVLFPPYLQH